MSYCIPTLFQPVLLGVLLLTPLWGVTQPVLMVLMSDIDIRSRTVNTSKQCSRTVLWSNTQMSQMEGNCFTGTTNALFLYHNYPCHIYYFDSRRMVVKMLSFDCL